MAAFFPLLMLCFVTWRFGKQIRYASRKARADTRRRVKGRFVKAGEAYDYDPSETRDFWDKTADFGLPSTLSTLTNVLRYLTTTIVKIIK